MNALAGGRTNEADIADRVHAGILFAELTNDCTGVKDQQLARLGQESLIALLTGVSPGRDDTQDEDLWRVVEKAKVS